MDIQTIINSATHFITSAHGISYYQSDTCAECGSTVHTNGSPWVRFGGISIADSAEEARTMYGMTEIKDEPNECFYSEDTATNECCCECLSLS